MEDLAPRKTNSAIMEGSTFQGIARYILVGDPQGTYFSMSPGKQYLVLETATVLPLELLNYALQCYVLTRAEAMK